jgi:putative ABC transport system substrate-binding protein
MQAALHARGSVRARRRGNSLITRRHFLAFLAITWLATSRAAGQPRDKVWRLGYLALNPLTDPPSPERAAFLAALREMGYVPGTNLVIEYRSANSDREQLPFLAEELVLAKLDAIVVSSSDSARAALGATKSVPIIMLGVGDPLAFGLVSNLARPGSNITGTSRQSVESSGKRFGLLKEVLPRATRVAYLWNPDSVASDASNAAVRQRAKQIGFPLDELRVANSDELQLALQSLERRRPDALYISVDPRIASYRQIIAEAAVRLKLPSMAGYRLYAEAGGLMSYADSLPELYRRGATYVDRVFRGAKPADLPIEQPTKFELVLNLKTAKALGLTIPQSLLVRADEVIQ